MRPTVERIHSYSVPASGSVARDVEAYVASRVSELVSDLPEDPMLEVATTPRGDYVEVMIFASKKSILARLAKKIDAIHVELRAMGVASAFYVRTSAGLPQTSGPA